MALDSLPGLKPTLLVCLVQILTLTKVKSLRQACRKLAAHYSEKLRNSVQKCVASRAIGGGGGGRGGSRGRTAQCTATVRRKFMAHNNSA